MRIKKLSKKYLYFNTNLKNKILYIILISGIIPATYLFGITLMFLYLFATDGNLGWSRILMIFCFLCGICGYIGLIMILKGLHRTKQLQKSIFLILGLIGFIIFANYSGMNNVWNWILYFEEPEEWFIIMLPLIVSGIFLTLILSDFIKHRRKKNCGQHRI